MSRSWLQTCTSTSPALSIVQRQVMKPNLCLYYLNWPVAKKMRARERESGGWTGCTEAVCKINYLTILLHNYGKCNPMCHNHINNVNPLIWTESAVVAWTVLVYSKVMPCRHSFKWLMIGWHLLVFPMWFSWIRCRVGYQKCITLMGFFWKD